MRNGDRVRASGDVLFFHIVKLCIHFLSILALYFISFMKFDSIWKKEVKLRKSAIEGNGHSGCGPEGRYVAGSRK